MTQQLIISNGRVRAVHFDDQDVSADYPDCECVQWDGDPVGCVEDSMDFGPDPRTDDQKEADAKEAAIASVVAVHQAEAEQGVTLSNGWRMRYADEAIANYMQIKNLIDLAGGSLPTLPIYDATGSVHSLSASEMLAVLAEYAVKVAIERQRQFAELAAMGW